MEVARESYNRGAYGCLLYTSSGDGKADGSDAAIDHDREVVYGSASLITNFNVKYVTSQNALQALDQVYDALAVSYTHLDVYKRQGLWRSECPAAIRKESDKARYYRT